jgi:hypothetical protein
MIESCESAKRISDVKDIIPQENGNEKNSTTDLINKQQNKKVHGSPRIGIHHSDSIHKKSRQVSLSKSP